jgi:hypothetical protein
LGWVEVGEVKLGWIRLVTVTLVAPGGIRMDIWDCRGVWARALHRKGYMMIGRGGPGGDRRGGRSSAG